MADSTTSTSSPTVDFTQGDELYFEYRKYLAEGDTQKHRHSMIAVKSFKMDFDCELRRHTAIYEHAHLLKLKVDLHRDNKELELHWLDEPELPEMYLTQYDVENPTAIKTKWRLAAAKPLSLKSKPSPDSPDLKRYTMILVHGGFEPCNDNDLVLVQPRKA